MATAQNFQVWERQNLHLIPDSDMVCDTVHFGNFMYIVNSGVEGVRKVIKLVF
jgi:hypothetical protein